MHQGAGSDSRVEAPGDDIGEAVIDHQIEPNVRIGDEELREEGRKDEPGCDARKVQPDQTPGLTLPGAGLLNRAVQFGHRRPHMIDQGQARFRGSHAPGRPVEQSDSKPIFEGPDGPAQGGRRHTEAGSGLPEAPIVEDGHEGCQFGELSTLHIDVSKGNSPSRL